jgi:methionyl-tRNA formyltransferase
VRLALFANGWVGWQISQALTQEDEIVALVVHPEKRATFRNEIVAACSLNPQNILEGDSLRSPKVAAHMKSLHPEIGVSANFGYILKPELFESFPHGCINIHSGYLPFNRGANPNVWSIVDETPAGVTIHYIDEGIDTGDVIMRQQVNIEPTDTGGSLYEKLQQASIDLFARAWPLIRMGAAPRIPQDPGSGTFHLQADLTSLDEIELEQGLKARRLLNIVRARTFPGYPGATFTVNGRQVSLEVALRYVSDEDG